MVELLLQAVSSSSMCVLKDTINTATCSFKLQELKQTKTCMEVTNAPLRCATLESTLEEYFERKHGSIFRACTLLPVANADA